MTKAMTICSHGNLRTRAEVNAASATLLRKFISDLGISTRRFAQEAGIAESTLRFFLSNGNARNVKNPGRYHGRGPYLQTLRPLLNLSLPEEVREALLDAIHYEDRMVARIFRKNADQLGQSEGAHKLLTKDDATNHQHCR
jgi:hypothetical protein